MKNTLLLTKFLIAIVIFSSSSFSIDAQSKIKRCVVTHYFGAELHRLVGDATKRYIKKKISREFDKVWGKIDSQGSNLLPVCVYDALQEVKKNFPIIINWENKCGIFFRGDVAGYEYFGEYRDYQIIIYCIYEEEFWTRIFRLLPGNTKGILLDMKYCLKGLLFHELLHLALMNHAKGKINGSDEAVAEDCSLKLFPCAPDTYKDAEGGEFSNSNYEAVKSDMDTRACNPKGDDCICEEKSPPNKDLVNKCGNDTPDDNHSFSSGLLSDYRIPCKALILRSGHYHEMASLIDGLFFEPPESAENLIKVSKVMVLPSGSLAGREHDSVLKAMFQEYVRLGGTIVALSQQYGSHIKSLMPQPEGQALDGFGWREDQSCLKNSSFFEVMHPVLSSCVNGMVDVGVDGYFSKFPENGTSILTRRVNIQPALLYYPYGEGTVILTSMFTDWATAHSQASATELNVLRDLLTFAQDPSATVPMYDLQENPTPTVQLNVGVKNVGEEASSSVRFIVSTPDRSRVLFETIRPAVLNSMDEGEFEFQFTLPEIEDAQLGICHVDYELLDANGDVVQMKNESPSGRFALYRMREAFVYKGGYVSQWMTADKDPVYWPQDIMFTVHFKNLTDETQTIQIDKPFLCVGHECSGGRYDLDQPISLEIDPGETAQHTFPFSSSHLNPDIDSMYTFRLQYYDDQQVLKQVGHGKTAWVLGSQTKSSITLNTDTNVKAGGTLPYSIRSRAIKYTIPGNYRITLYLDRLSGYENGKRTFETVKTLYQTEHDFSVENSFSYDGTYTPPVAHPTDFYRLRLMVEASNGSREPERVKDFFYDRSGFGVRVTGVEKDGQAVTTLIPGEIYTIPVKIENLQSYDYDVKQGSYTLRLRSSDGVEIFKKEATNLEIASGEQIVINEPFTFQPPAPGFYTLEYLYKDETREPAISSYYWAGGFRFNETLQVFADKPMYRALDTAKIDTTIVGTGNYQIVFSCPDANVQTEQTIDIPAGQYNGQVQFQLPIGWKTSYEIQLTATGHSGTPMTQQTRLGVEPFQLLCDGQFSSPIATVSMPLGFSFKSQCVSGLYAPLPLELKVTSPGLNFSESRNIVLQPVGENAFQYTIPIPETVSAGSHSVTATFFQGTTPIFSKSYFISIPEPYFTVELPQTSYQAGDVVRMELTNGGGVPATIPSLTILRDDFGREVYRSEIDLTLNAGVATTLTIPIEETLKSGQYTLEQQIGESNGTQTFRQLWRLNVQGLSSMLKSYTLKDIYSPAETVNAKSEIKFTEGLPSGVRLEAEIGRNVSGGGVSVFEMGHFEEFNTVYGGGGKDGVLYLANPAGWMSYDLNSGATELIAEETSIDPTYAKAFFDSGGNLWLLGSYEKILRRDAAGNWQTFSGYIGGLRPGNLFDITEYTNSDGTSEVWLATLYGICVYRDGQWSWITTDDGLPSKYVYKFAHDAEGNVWISTLSGIFKYDGSNFVSVGAPFGTTAVTFRLGSGPAGDVWAATSDAVYCYKAGSWQSWPTDDLGSYFRVDDIVSDDEAAWLRGKYYGSSGWVTTLMKTGDSGFESFNSSDISILTNIRNVIPYRGPGAFFCYGRGDVDEVGLVTYDAANTTEPWSHGFIEAGSQELLAFPYGFTATTDGRLWARYDFGLSVSDGNFWQHMTTIPGTEELMGRVMGIEAGPDGSLYALISSGVMKINDNTSDIIPFPSGYQGGRLAIDAQSRIWITYLSYWGYGTTWYYDGSWHTFAKIGYEKIEPDSSGGVWCVKGASLTHIKADLQTAYYTTTNSDLLSGDYDYLYCDQNDTLWISVFDWASDRYLFQSFNGQQWENWSEYEGYPESGLAAVTTDNAGQMYGLEDNGWWNDWGLYKKVGMSYEKIPASFIGDSGVNRDPVILNGHFYFTGRIKYPDDSEPYGVLKIGLSSGGFESLWQGSFTVDAAANSEVVVPIETGETFAAGSYVLKTELKGPEGQLLAASNDGFAVQAAGLSVSLFGGSSFVRALKGGETLDIEARVKNGLDSEETNLRLDVVALSPNGTETVLLSKNIGNLASGVEHLETVSFSSDETGGWKITGRLVKDEAAPLRQVDVENQTLAVAPLSEASLLVDVETPTVTVDASAPQFAGDEAFETVVRVKNEGNVEARVQMAIEAMDDSTSFLSEELILKPKTEKILSFTNTIKADRNYRVSGSGDASIEQTIAVKYGNAVSLAAEIPTALREGTVSVGLHLTHSEGLALKEAVQYELYLDAATAPLYSLARNYSFSPAGETIDEALSFALSPGVYRLTWQSAHVAAGEQIFTVQPSGIGAVIFTSETRLLSGRQELTFGVTNSDSVAGSIPVAIRVAAADGSVLIDETRHYYLLPGEARQDSLTATFAATGNYPLTFSGAKLATPLETVLQVVDAVNVEASLEIGSITEASIPVSVQVADNGFETFTGRVVLEAGGAVSEEIITVEAGQSKGFAVKLPVATLTPGVVPVTVTLYDSQGNVLKQATSEVTVLGPDIRLVEFPEALSVDAGNFAPVPLKLQNLGHQRGEASFTVSAFDNLRQTRQIALEAGEELTLDEIVLDIAADMPSGTYPFYYTLEGTGVNGGSLKNNFKFTVNGVALDVQATLDRSIYKVGETATLEISVSGPMDAEVPLEVVINWGPFSKKETITLSGSANLNVAIPVDAARPDKVFVGVYHEGGKGIYLNDYYLRVGGTIESTLDRGLYNPGDVVHAVFATQEAGTITATAFGETQELPISSSASTSFTIPLMTLGGSYAVTWTFTPTDTSKPPISGGIPFDVSGLVVKVAGSSLNEGKYAPGDTIEASYIFESNHDQSLEMRTWLEHPTGTWEYLGEQGVMVSGTRQVHAASSYQLATTQAGTHRLIYGLFRQADEAQLVVAGMQSFDVGDAVLVALETEHFEYKTGTEDVLLKATCYGTGPATIEWFLDDTTIGQQPVTLSEMTYIDRTLPAASIEGGRHSIRAVITKDSLTSAKSTSFLYGTELPDLAVYASHDNIDGLDITYKVQVINQGKTPSTESTLVHKVDDTTLTTKPIPSLAPNQTLELTLPWNARGQAGDHEVAFIADPGNQLKEFNEENNIALIEESIPELFFDLKIEPITWAAHTDTSIIARLINNKETDASFNLDMTITSDSSGLPVYQQQGTTALTAFQQKIITRHFNTAVTPAGSYTITSTVSNDTTNITRELPIYIHPTKSLEGTLTIIPTQIITGIDSEVELELPLKNTGNVALDEEPLKIEVSNQETGDILFTGQTSISLDIEQETTLRHTITLNLPEGEYQINVSLEETEQKIASAPLLVIMPIEMEKTISASPRPLLMHLQQGGKTKQAANLIESILAQANLPFETVAKLRHSYTKLLSAQHNIHIAMGNIKNRHLRDLLTERVHYGDALILFCDQTINTPELTNILGVEIENIPAKPTDRTIDLIPSDLSSGGTIELIQPLHKCLKKISDDTKIIAQTTTSQLPIIAHRPYGNGHILTIALHPNLKSGIPAFSDLLLTAIDTFNRPVFTQSDLTRILPLNLTLTYTGQDPQIITLKELFPYGATGLNFNPPLEDPDQLSWKLTLAANSEWNLFYWLKLPDDINTYEIKSEIYDGTKLLNEETIEFEVSQTVNARITEILQQIDLLSLSSTDRHFATKAVNHLQNLQSRTPQTIDEYFANVKDAVSAARAIASITSTDPTPIRRRIQTLIPTQTRPLYDLLISLQPAQLNNTLNRIITD